MNFGKITALLRRVDNPFELARVLCIKGRVEVARSEPHRARETLADAEAIAAPLEARPDSAIGREINKLRELLT